MLDNRKNLTFTTFASGARRFTASFTQKAAKALVKAGATIVLGVALTLPVANMAKAKTTSNSSISTIAPGQEAPSSLKQGRTPISAGKTLKQMLAMSEMELKTYYKTLDVPNVLTRNITLFTEFKNIASSAHEMRAIIADIWVNGEKDFHIVHQFIADHEGSINYLYTDGGGVPTIGTGLALVVKGAKGGWTPLPVSQIKEIFTKGGVASPAEKASTIYPSLQTIAGHLNSGNITAARAIINSPNYGKPFKSAANAPFGIAMTKEGMYQSARGMVVYSYLLGLERYTRLTKETDVKPAAKYHYSEIAKNPLIPVIIGNLYQSKAGINDEMMTLFIKDDKPQFIKYSIISPPVKGPAKRYWNNVLYIAELLTPQEQAKMVLMLEKEKDVFTSAFRRNSKALQHIKNDNNPNNYNNPFLHNISYDTWIAFYKEQLQEIGVQEKQIKVFAEGKSTLPKDGVIFTSGLQNTPVAIDKKREKRQHTTFLYPKILIKKTMGKGN